MTTAHGWKDRSGTGFHQYDFIVPANWTTERIRLEQAAIITSLEGLGEGIGHDEPGWIQLARLLPEALCLVLIAELRAGNQVAGIGALDWPHEGSIVVSLCERFSVARRNLPSGVNWRMFNDPHYAREEISQTVNLTTFLLIA